MKPTSVERADCPACSHLMKRRFSFSTPPMYHGGFEPTMGKHISTATQRDNELAKMSAAATERTGVQHSYKYHSGADFRDAAKATDEGMDSTYAAQTSTGQRESKLWL